MSYEVGLDYAFFHEGYKGSLSYCENDIEGKEENYK